MIAFLFLFILFLIFIIFGTIKKIKEFRMQLKAIASIYSSVYMADLENDTFAEVHGKEGDVRHLVGKKMTNAQKTILQVMSVLTDEKQREQMFSFVNLKTLPERLLRVNTITEEFMDNKNTWCRGRFIVMERNKSGKAIRVLWCVEIIDEEKRHRDKLQILSESDPLTKISNRRSGEEKIRTLLEKHHNGMLCLIDVDFFKTINDTYGHDEGDRVLIMFAECLKTICREDDVVSRFGGDEFVIFTKDICTQENAEAIVQRLFSAVRELNEKKFSHIKISISLGVRFVSQNNNASFEEIFRQADLCMYKSKKISGNSVTFWSETDSPFDFAQGT